MTDTVVSPQHRARAAASLFASLRPLIGVINRPATVLAGSRLLPFWSVVRHRGRRSGRSFATPVAARRTADGFAIPLAFGETADWCRNLIAAGGGVVRWSGRDYTLSDPRIVDAERAVAAVPPLRRPFL